MDWAALHNSTSQAQAIGRITIPSKPSADQRAQESHPQLLQVDYVGRACRADGVGSDAMYQVAISPLAFGGVQVSTCRVVAAPSVTNVYSQAQIKTV